MNRSSSGFAIPPTSYGPPKGHFYKGADELDRFRCSFNSSQQFGGEDSPASPSTPSRTTRSLRHYLDSQGMQPSRTHVSVGGNKGLMELHYSTMKKRAADRDNHLVKVADPLSPSMAAPHAAGAGYSGHIPGKISENIVGCSWKVGSNLAHETFSLRRRSASSPSLQ